MEYKDYYKILGVDKNANTDQIKKAYRKLARQCHPDVNPGDKKAEEKFKDVNEAYEVLSDPEKRKKYERFGTQWQQYEHAGGVPDDFWAQWGGQGGGRTRTRTVRPEEFEQMFGGAGGFSDFFEALFGGMGGAAAGGASRQENLRSRPRRGRDSEHVVQVTLEEASRGTQRVLQWEDGRKIEASIPPGVRSGSRIRLCGQGQAGTSGGECGDLYLKVELSPHPVFQLEGNDLKVTVAVDLYAALLGGEVDVPTLDRPVKLNIPPETANGKVFRLRGLGMPHLRQPDRRGDLYATVAVQLPQRLSQKEKELLGQLQALRQT
ncbi:MAG: J domain-containing protein [Thermoflexales bacterium]|nr:J domain-containing protein [Thermoflexales bacterium]